MRLSGSTQFTARFLLPIAAVTGITIVALAWFLAWSAQRIDDDALTRDKVLLERAIAELGNQLYLAQDEVAVWDEAVDAVASGDQQWLVENLGTYVYDSYGHNRSLILDASGTPIMAMREGGHVRAKSATEAAADLAPMLADLASVEIEAQISAYNSGVSDEAPHARDFAHYEGHPALVSIMPILSYSGENAPTPGTEALYVSVLLLDEMSATYLGDQYRIAGPQFVNQQPAPELSAQMPISNKAGQPIAWLTWQADQSGTRLLQAAMPALVSAFAIGVLIVTLLLASLYRAMNALQAQREEASHRALHDPLTGLGNRSLFRTRLHEGFLAMQAGEPRLAVLALDLDRFKQVNDTLGHAAGDELLTAVAARLATLMRPEDTLIRFGGDEFAIIMPGIRGHAQPQALAEAIIETLSRPVLLAAGAVSIGVSIGIATAPDLAHGETELLRFADDALYRAKNGGRNRYCLYTPDAPPEPARRQAQVQDAFARQSA